MRRQRVVNVCVTTWIITAVATMSIDVDQGDRLEGFRYVEAKESLQIQLNQAELQQLSSYSADVVPSANRFSARKYSARVLSERMRYNQTVIGNLRWVDPLIGTYGDEPNQAEYGGQSPTPSPPFAAVRIAPMTRQNKVASEPYYYTDQSLLGFLMTRQPAIWMGDYGFVAVSPGLGKVEGNFTRRGREFDHSDEFATPFKYSVGYKGASDGLLTAEAAGTEHGGILRFKYSVGKKDEPNVLIQATRSGWRGAIFLDPDRKEISGWNPERFDYRLGPQLALNFRGYFVARVDGFRSKTRQPAAWSAFGTAVTNETLTELHPKERGRWNEENLGGWVTFPNDVNEVEVKIGMSLISIEQARFNLGDELAGESGVDEIAEQNVRLWRNKVDLVDVDVQGGVEEQMRILYTGLYHQYQFPSKHSEKTPTPPDDGSSSEHYYSSYTDSIHFGVAYQSYSIWDIFRAQWGFLILFAPERISAMISSMLDIFDQSGRLPIWADLTETNIMISSWTSSLFAEALRKGIKDFDKNKAWMALRKDADIPPEMDLEIRYDDREEFTPLEARAGLTTYKKLGWVAHELTSESVSRTLDYAICDWTVGKFAELLGGYDEEAKLYFQRSQSYVNSFNSETGFMAPRFGNGSFLDIPLDAPLARQDGFTEGNQWDYTFNVIHEVEGLSTLLGGREAMRAKLDQHFKEGHNDPSNEPSQHIPYLYAMIGQPSRTQERVRAIAKDSYSDKPDGIPGNEDCGQQSAWYFFSTALGVYPVNPASGNYTVGSPHFERVVITLPGRAGHMLTVNAKGARDNIYVKSLSINGIPVSTPVVTFEQIVQGGVWDFEMSAQPQLWGT